MIDYMHLEGSDNLLVQAIAQAQARRAKVADGAETRAFVDAVHAELDLTYRIFRAEFNPLLAPGKCGKVGDPELRTLIVKTYDRAAQILHATWIRISSL
ncbi:hypothetical protein [Paraburkholderia terrae]